jgi:hypothetical protein
MLKARVLPLLIFLLSFIWTIQFVSTGFFYDGVLFQVALSNPFHWTFDFMKHLWLEPNAWDDQYRPIGFYLYFWAFRALFGLKYQYWHLVSSLVFSCAVVGLWFVLGLFKFRIAARICGILFFIFHLSHLFSLLELSNGAKYIWTLFLFVSGIYIVLSREKLSRTDLGKLFFLCLFSLFCHEGSLTFGLVFFLIAQARFKKFEIGYFVLLIPALFYISMRLLFWNLPDQGLMAVHFSEGPRILIKILIANLLPVQVSADEPQFFSSNLGFEIFFAISLVTAFVGLTYSSLKSKSYLNWAIFLSGIILLLPFSSISRHLHDLYLKAFSWSAVPFAILIAILADRLLNQRGIKQFVGVGILVGYLIAQLVAGEYLLTRLRRDAARAEMQYGEFLKVLDQQIALKPEGPYLIKSIGANLGDSAENEIPLYYNELTVAALLAVHKPQTKFTIISQSSRVRKFRSALIVDQGYIYEIVDKGGGWMTRDLFMHRIERAPTAEVAAPELEVSDLDWQKW